MVWKALQGIWDLKFVSVFLLVVLLSSCVKSDPLSQQFSQLPTPQVDFLHSMPSAVRGGAVMMLQFSSKSTSVLGVTYQTIEFSEDGGDTYREIAKLDAQATSYSWTVPVIDTNTAVLRLSAYDKLNHSSAGQSPAFRIVSTKPGFTEDQQTDTVANRLSTLSFGGSCEDALPILIEINASPLTQIVCSASNWSYSASASVDGSFSYHFYQVDPVGNKSEVDRLWIRDTLAPVLTQTLVPNTVINNSNPTTFGGTCESGLKVQVTAIPSNSLISEVTCSLNQWSYSATAAGDGTLQFRFSETDAVGNAAPSILVSWTLDKVGPVFTQTVAPSSSVSSAASLNIGGSCDNSLPIQISLTTPSGTSNQNLTCSSGAWSYTIVPPSGAQGEGSFQVQASQTDVAGNKTEISLSWTHDSVAPVLLANSFKLANGASSTITNYISTALQAVDTTDNITHFCLSYTFSVTPGLTNSCWVAVNNPDQPNLIPAKTLNLSNYFYRIGYTQGTYTVYAWVRDEAGNISTPLSQSIIYNPGTPPSVVNVIAAAMDNPVLPLSEAAMTINQNSPVYIFWKVATAANGLNSQPVQLMLTTDDVNYTSIASSLPNASNGGCTADGNRASGCYVWNSTVASSTYFRIRVMITDKNGMITAVTTNPINSSGLSSIAGNTDTGVGASATSAMFINARLSIIQPDPGSLVITKEGVIFFRDKNVGLLYMQPTDGVVKVLLPLKPSSSNTFEGPVSDSRASVQSLSKMALDFQNGLLLWDVDRIRRIDLTSWTISTFVGGGSSSADGVGPRQVKINEIFCCNLPEINVSLIPFPNGDLIFQSDNYSGTPGSLRYYHKSTGLVDSITVSGIGHGPVYPNSFADSDGIDIRTEDLATCTKTITTGTYNCTRYSYGIEYEPVSSQMVTLQAIIYHAVDGSAMFPTANLVPSGPNIGQSLAPHPATPTPIYQGWIRPTGRDGKIYLLNKEQGQIYRFNKAGNSWDKLAGLDKAGACADGTAALSCAIQPLDLFVDAQSHVFFIDRGRIRTIDDQGKVVTVYGQSFYFGDNGLAISSRFNVIRSLDLVSPDASNVNGRVALYDEGEFRIREFGVGANINTIAGNGTNAWPDLVTPANAQPYAVDGAGAVDSVFSVNTTSGDVYASQGGAKVVKLNRQTGFWNFLTNTMGTYVPNILGFDGVNALVHNNTWNATLGLKDSYFELVNVNTGARTTFVGTAGSSRMTMASCPNNTPANSCVLPPAYSVGMVAMTYDPIGESGTPRWLGLLINSADIRTFPATSNAPVGTLVTLPRTAANFTYVREGSQEIVYYCANSDGKLYKKIIGGADTALPWRIASMACTGYSLKYSSALNSLIFPYVQNAMYGIGQYQLAP